MRKKLLLYAGVLLLLAGMFMPTQVFARDELKNTDPDKYYILLDCRNQIVTVFEKDDQGEYTRVVRRMLCTTGRTQVDEDDPEDKATPTPSGIWKIGARERFGKFASFQNEYARYWTQIVDGVYFHSIMFSQRDIDTLKRGAFNTLGRKASHGCVRLYVEDAKWLYYYACPGTTVEVSNDEPKNQALAKALRTTMSFADYNEFQKNLYDEPEQPNRTAWVSVEGAPLRTGNGSNDRVIRKLEEGTELEVLQEGDPWIKADIDGKEGYIKRAFVTYEKGVMQSHEDADVMKSTAYMYESPSKDAQKIVKVPHDTTLKILEPDNDGWTKIQYFTSVGYIESKYIIQDWGVILE